MTSPWLIPIRNCIRRGSSTWTLRVGFQDLGLQQLKNIAQLVHVYRVQAEQAATTGTQTRPALALPDKPSIAIMPFANLCGDQKEDYFSDGITEDIITELSRFSELFVIARNSSLKYKGKSPDLRQARCPIRAGGGHSSLGAPVTNYRPARRCHYRCPLLDRSLRSGGGRYFRCPRRRCAHDRLHS